MNILLFRTAMPWLAVVGPKEIEQVRQIRDAIERRRKERIGAEREGR
jgi:hypothetical protein